MKNELRDVLIAQLEKVNKVNAELKLRLSDVIKSSPDSEGSSKSHSTQAAQENKKAADCPALPVGGILKAMTILLP